MIFPGRQTTPFEHLLSLKTILKKLQRFFVIIIIIFCGFVAVSYIIYNMFSWYMSVNYTLNLFEGACYRNHGDELETVSCFGP